LAAAPHGTHRTSDGHEPAAEVGTQIRHAAPLQLLANLVRQHDSETESPRPIHLICGLVVAEQDLGHVVTEASWDLKPDGHFRSITCQRSLMWGKRLLVFGFLGLLLETLRFLD